MNATQTESAEFLAPDGAYAMRRMGLGSLVAAIFNVGMWSVIVVLPAVQAEFGVNRGGASLPYSLMMIGLAFGAVALGRLADQFGFAAPLALAGVLQGLGYLIAAFAPNIVVFALAHLLLIGPAPALRLAR